jgi:hypothetical protein
MNSCFQPSSAGSYKPLISPLLRFAFSAAGVKSGRGFQRSSWYTHATVCVVAFGFVNGHDVVLAALRAMPYSVYGQFNGSCARYSVGIGPPDESLLCHHGMFGSNGICLAAEEVVVDTDVCDVTCEVEVVCGVAVELEVEVVLAADVEELLVDVDCCGIGDGGALGVPKLVVERELLAGSCGLGSGGALGLSCGFLGTWAPPEAVLEVVVYFLKLGRAGGVGAGMSNMLVSRLVASGAIAADTTIVGEEI